MPQDNRHAGVHWPANAGGEHPDRETIYNLPGVDLGCLLMCADSARYWYNEARSRCPTVVWRAIPRPGRRPADLGWNPKRVAEEVVNLWDEQSHDYRVEGLEWFLPLNELQFDKESGEDFRGYGPVANSLEQVRQALAGILPPSVKFVYPAWVPRDELAHTEDWVGLANKWDAICLHTYGAASDMVARYYEYRQLFPRKPIIVGEWNANHTGADEAEALRMWADVASKDPLFLGATYYIWETKNGGEEDFSIWGSAQRLALFQNPLVAKLPKEAPVPDSIPAVPNPWEFWTPEQIAAASDCPLDAVNDNWPHVYAQLCLVGLTSKNTQAAVIGNMAVETAHQFEPIHEFRMGDGSIPPWWYNYDGGPLYHGRGDLQITHKYNYADLGPKIAALWGASPADPTFDLVTNPDNLLDKDMSAAAMAIYIRDHGREDGDGIPEAADRGDFPAVRRLVQGGTDGLDTLVNIVTALGVASAPVVNQELLYGPDVPDYVTLQKNKWTCSIRSTYAALWAMNQVGTGGPVTYGDNGPNDVYNWLVPSVANEASGLLLGSGEGLAAALRDHGYDAKSEFPVTLDRVRELAGKVPVMVGGSAWNHWVDVRGKTSDGGLSLENPSPGYDGITDYIRDSWGRLGPMAMVWVEGWTPPVVAPQTEGLDLATAINLVGNAYNEDGVIIPALLGARSTGDWTQVDAVVSWLRNNRK
jgi:predicted chitinase